MSSIKPDFDFTGIGLDDIQADAATLVNELNQEQNNFPFNVFPDAMQCIVIETNECLNFPIDYISTSLLFASSVAMGNSCKLRIKNRWSVNAVLYLALVGKRGVSKSHPSSFAIKPIEDIDHKNYLEYEAQLEHYNYLNGLKKNELSEIGEEKPERPPILKQHLLSDFTIEALVNSHKYNLRGLGVYVDELATWLNNFTRYNKGSEEQFWLSNWSEKPIKTNRINRGATNIPKPFISVCGTIQPNVLKELISDKVENGFSDRLLFAFPEGLTRSKIDFDKDLSQGISESWSNIISKLLSLDFKKAELGSRGYNLLTMSQEAKAIYKEWQNLNVDKGQLPEYETTDPMQAKYDVYCFRIALILQMLFWACGEGDKETVSTRAMKGAIEVMRYFKNTACKIQFETINPLESLTKDKQQLYIALPDTFTTNEGEAIADSLNIPKRTFADFLSKQALFERLKRGLYQKLC